MLLETSGSVRFNLEDARRTELRATPPALPWRAKICWVRRGRFLAELQDEIVWQIVNEEGEGTLIAWLQQHGGGRSPC